tara:strand:+ start:2526 stop:3374 length:849 start_codon:yes stop_codon:yes gene_type:complete
MKKIVSISGGKSSAYILANYPSDYAVFSLVRTDDIDCLYPDKKIRQIVSDKIGKEFIGTLEQDAIIKIVLELEQFTGKKIDWVSGITFDEVLMKKGGWLPNQFRRYCTTNLKLIPIFHWWYNKFNDPVKMAIGFRANETKRANRMNEKLNKNGLLEIKATVTKHLNGRNKWEIFEWQKPYFPLIENQILADKIHRYWNENKQVPFVKGYYNNCVGCFHRNPLFIKKMSAEHPNKIKWFANQEGGKNGYWKSDIKYKDILKWDLQQELTFDDFSDCDSGYCGL